MSKLHMTLGLRDESADDPVSLNGSEPLVPILRVDDGKVDPVALATWHEALSNTLSVEVPHDLLGLWLYPSQGGVVLLGPDALAQDDLVIPIPAPYLKPEQLALLEEIILDAGYGSAICLPIRFGKRDVALLLVADLQPDRYGPVERVVLQCVAQKVAPMLGRIARQWTVAEGSMSRQQERIAGLLETVARANRDGKSPQQFLAAIGRGLAPLLPHEHIELLVPDAEGKQFFRLGEHPGGPLWSDRSLIISPEHLDITAIVGSRGSLLVSDTYEDDRWPRGFLTSSEAAGGDIRSVVGTRLNLRGRPAGFLLVGSVGPDLYGSEDAELLVLLGGLILPQIAEFIRAEDSPPPRPMAPLALVVPDEREAPAEHLLRIARALATTSDAAAATALIASEAAQALPFDSMTFALRHTASDRVVLLQPGERRAVLATVTGTPLARVLSGEAANEYSRTTKETRLVVPLRVASRVHGALIFRAGPDSALSETHTDVARRLADIVAAHHDLLRRAVLLPPPYTPGWKRTEKA